jgi:hypothetical protein
MKRSTPKSGNPVTAKSNSADPAYLAGINEAIGEINREREPLVKLMHARPIRVDERGWAIRHKLMALNVALRHLKDTRGWQQGNRPSESLDIGSQRVIQEASILLKALAGNGHTSALGRELRSFTEFLSKCGISIPINTLNIIWELTDAVLMHRENEIAKKLAELSSQLEAVPNNEADEGPSQAEIDQVVEDLLRNGPEAEDLP